MVHSQLQTLMNYHRRQETPGSETNVNMTRVAGGRVSLRVSSTIGVIGKSDEYKRVP